jgi:hypothetical protein
VAGAVRTYLGSLSLEGPQVPLAAAAVLVAESLQDAPEYARARLARELRDSLKELAALVAERERERERESELAARREARARQGRWAADGG